MTIQLHERNTTNVLWVRVSGKLVREAYDTLVPEIERLLKEHGKPRVLFDMVDFHGWRGDALWEDITFELTHFAHIERVAIVGDRKWEKGMSIFCKPLAPAEIRYFDRAQIDAARTWVEGD